MDISYLLWLQGVRETLPGFIEQIFVVISAVAASEALVFLAALLYWCLDKKCGAQVVLTFSIGCILNNVIKCIACVYRPWIRSADIRPAAGALAEATGYSFPSGHVQSSACLFGTAGWNYRKRWPWAFVLCCVFVLLVAFSRNFLGVHTPQDVIVGLIESIAVIALTSCLIRWVDAAEGRDLIVLIAAIVLTVAAIALVWFKPYPIDLDASGTAIVNPIEMQVDFFKSTGVFLGGFLGWFCERRFVSFETDPHAGIKAHAIRFAVGAVVLLVLHFAPRPLLLLGLDERWYQLIKNFLTIFAAAFVSPLAFTAVEHRMAK